jgi:serine/threonine-protein kinase
VDGPGAYCVHCGGRHPRSFAHCPETGHAITAGQGLVGHLVANRYRVKALLGEGGMGAVYEAEHVLLGRPVALKRLHPTLAADDVAVRRFQLEARAAAATGHPHVVDILDLGFAEDGAPYLVMELLSGEPLSGVLERDDSLSPPRACRIAMQVLDALEAVHARGIVHRDLKPDNVFLSRSPRGDGHVKVVDFGISKIRGDRDEGLGLTGTGVLLGTPYYMSPEQARGALDLDSRVDLYAVGVILYEALCGRRPFAGDNYHALLHAVLEGDPVPLETRAPAVSRDLADIVRWAMAPDRERRVDRASELRRALEPFAGTAGDDRPSDAAKRASGFGPTEHGAIPAVRTRLGRPPDPASARPSRRPWPSSAPPSAAGKQVAGMQGGDVHASDMQADSMRSGDVQASGTAARVKAVWPLELLSHLADAHGAAVRDDVLARVPPRVKDAIEGLVLPMSWVPYVAYVALLEAATERLDGHDAAVATAIGSAIAAAELPRTHGPFLREATPALAGRHLPRILAGYLDRAVQVASDAPGVCRVSLPELDPPSDAFERCLLGFVRQALVLVGARDVRAKLERSRARGDDASVIVVTWR